MAIKEKALELIGKGAMKVKVHSPEIMLAAGIAAIVCGTVLAVKNAPDANEVMDEVKTQLDEVHEKKDSLEKKEYGKLVGEVYKRGFLVFTRYYVPSIALHALGIGLVLKSHGTIKGRYLNAVAAYDALSGLFEDYRGRVVDELGVEKDQHFLDGTRKEKIKDENGKNQEVEIIDKPKHVVPTRHELTVMLDSRSWPDFDRYEIPLMLEVLQCRLDCLNDGRMAVYKHMWLDQILRDIGYEIDDPEFFIPNIRSHGCLNKIDYSFKPVKVFDSATGEYDDAIRLTIFTDGDITNNIDELKYKSKKKNLRIPNVKGKIIKGEH